MHSQDWEPLAWQVAENSHLSEGSSIDKGRFSAHPPATLKAAGSGGRTPTPGGAGRLEGPVGAQPPRGPSSVVRAAGGVRARAWGPESRELGGRSKWDHLLHSSEVSALCQAPIPLAPPPSSLLCPLTPGTQKKTTLEVPMKVGVMG